MVMITSIRPQTRLRLAIFLILMAALFNALMAAAVKSADSASLSPEMLVFWRNLICLILTVPWVLVEFGKENFWNKIRSPDIGMQVIRSVAGIAAVYFFFLTLKFLSLSDATLLANVTPIFVPIVAWAWKKKPIHHRIWWGIGVAFCGIVFIMQPGMSVFDPAALIGVAGALCAAVAVLALRMAHYTDPASRTLFYYFLFGSFLTGASTLFNFTDNWLSLTLSDLVPLIGVGILGMVYQIFLTFAAKYAPIKLISCFMYMSVVFSMILQKWIWQRPIPLPTYLGFVLVLTGAMLVIFLYPKEKL